MTAEFKPSQVQRKTVSVAAGAGMSHEEIAIGLGISRPTLEKHFGYELSHGAYKRRLEVYDALHKTAVKGNVAAGKAYLAAGEPRAAAPPPEEGEKPKLGKKEQAAADATTAGEGTEWGRLLRPDARPN